MAENNVIELKVIEGGGSKREYWFEYEQQQHDYSMKKMEYQLAATDRKSAEAEVIEIYKKALIKNFSYINARVTERSVLEIRRPKMKVSFE